MKNLSYPMIVAVAGLLMASAGSANAGGTDSCCAGSGCQTSVAASPKLSATLQERCVSKCAAPDVSTRQAAPATQALANGSPKTQSQQQRPFVSTSGVDAPVATFRSTGDDGITASPKLRQMLDERRQTVEIAPLK